jgi:16S rRNA (cytidine1402-2'-O)-methyltransferase
MSVDTENDAQERTSRVTGELFIVGTPIGNLEDITLRALRTLRQVDLIAAEDTRRTRRLLSHYDIHTPMVSYHEHNERTRTPELAEKLKAGAEIALVSDAGMPGISDPGHDLIVAALQENIRVSVVPGPTAIMSALVLSGLRTDRFSFGGFAPRKSGERARYLEKILNTDATTILFESPNRLVSLLETIAGLSQSARLAIARELTKKFEETLRGPAAELAEHFKAHKPRGEFVVMIEGTSQLRKEQRTDARPGARKLVEALMREKGLSKKDAMRAAAKELGVSRREIYRTLLTERPSE